MFFNKKATEKPSNGSTETNKSKKCIHKKMEHFIKEWEEVSEEVSEEAQTIFKEYENGSAANGGSDTRREVSPTGRKAEDS